MASRAAANDMELVELRMKFEDDVSEEPVLRLLLRSSLSERSERFELLDRLERRSSLSLASLREKRLDDEPELLDEELERLELELLDDAVLEEELEDPPPEYEYALFDVIACLAEA